MPSNQSRDDIFIFRPFANTRRYGKWKVWLMADGKWKMEVPTETSKRIPVLSATAARLSGNLTFLVHVKSNFGDNCRFLNHCDLN